MALSLEQLTEQNRIQKKQIKLLIEAVRTLSILAECNTDNQSYFSEIDTALRNAENLEIMEGKRFD